jgi:hypothetical protein
MLSVLGASSSTSFARMRSIRSGEICSACCSAERSLVIATTDRICQLAGQRHSPVLCFAHDYAPIVGQSGCPPGDAVCSTAQGS